MDSNVVVLAQDGFLGASTLSSKVFIVVSVIEFTLEVPSMTPEFLALVLQSVEPLQESIPLLLGHFDFDRSRALGGFLDIDMPGAALSVVLNVVCCCRRIVVII